jgi:hypothetical protein
MQWKQSLLFPHYSISEFGDVCRIVPDRLGRLPVNNMVSRLDRGYRKYRLYRDGKSYHVKASQLVLDAFDKPKPFEGAEACHNDGDKSNNHYSNLRWDTHKGNHADTLIHGTRSRGERHGHAKLTVEQVKEIRTLSAMTKTEIAARFNVSRGAVRGILTGKNWAHA